MNDFTRTSRPWRQRINTRKLDDETTVTRELRIKLREAEELINELRNECTELRKQRSQYKRAYSEIKADMQELFFENCKPSGHSQLFNAVIYFLALTVIYHIFC